MNKGKKLLGEYEVEKLSDGKVGYYRETDESAPTVQIFMYGDLERIESIKLQIENKLESNDDFQNAIDDLNIEQLEDNYYRIFYVFGFDEYSKESLKHLINVMSNYGNAEDIFFD